MANQFETPHPKATFKTQEGAIRHAEKTIKGEGRYLISVTPLGRYFVVAFNIPYELIGYYAHNRIVVVR